MLKEIYTAALGMMPRQTKLEVIANNLANAQTTGFKREGVFQRTLLEARQNMHHIPGDIEQDDPVSTHYTDFKTGSFEKTGNALDLAIDGDGYFMLLDEEGNEFLSRAGRFTLARDGTISSPDGKALLGESGLLVVNEHFHNHELSNDSRPLEIRIHQSGDVYVNDENIGRIPIFSVENPQTLVRASNTQFSISEETDLQLLEAEKLNLRQGYLELSNVNIIQEMVDMIQTQRGFELGQKVITTNDGTLDRTLEISRVV